METQTLPANADDRYVLRAECVFCQKCQKTQTNALDERLTDLKTDLKNGQREIKEELCATKNEIEVYIEKVVQTQEKMMDSHQGQMQSMSSDIRAYSDNFSAYRTDFTQYQERLYKLALYVLFIGVTVLVGVIIGKSLDFRWIGLL